MRDLNFFSPYLEGCKKARKKNMTIGFVSILAAVIAMGFSVYYVMYSSHIEKEIADMNKVLTNPENIKLQKEVVEKSKRLEIIHEYITVMEATQKEIEKSDPIHTEFLDEITSAIPQELFFSMLSYQKRN